MSRASVWRRAQRAERRYQERKNVAASAAYRERYGRRLLAELPESWLALGPASRALDAGCGGWSLLQLLDAGERVGVDPLMGFYLERAPELRALPMRWVEAPLETWEPDAPFDLVLSLNMLDHTRDPRQVAARMASWLAPGGRLACVVNVHSSRFWRGYYQRFNRLVDPPHPHHFLAGEIPKLFPTLRHTASREIDHLWLDLRDGYDRAVMGRRRRGWRETLVNLANPFKYPVAAAELLGGRPFHRSRPEDRPLVATRLYLFERAASGGSPGGL